MTLDPNPGYNEGQKGLYGASDTSNIPAPVGAQEIAQVNRPAYQASVNATQAAQLAAGGTIAVLNPTKDALLDPDGGSNINLGGGGGGGPTIGLPTISAMGSVTLTTASDATPGTWTAFPSAACTELWLDNVTGATLEYRRGATGDSMIILPGQLRRIVGLANANEIDVRREDYGALVGGSRALVVRAQTITSDETFVVAGIKDCPINNGGANTTLPAIACTGAELVNVYGKDIFYRASSSQQYIRLPMGASVVLLGLTNLSAVEVQPVGNVAPGVRSLKVEAFTSGLRAPLNRQQPATILHPTARVYLPEQFYPAAFPAPPYLSMGEVVANGPDQLRPKGVINILQIKDVATTVSSAIANCEDVSDGSLDVLFGDTTVQFTQPIAGSYAWTAEPAMATGIDVTGGMIRLTYICPSGSPSYGTAGALTTIGVELHSTGSPTSPTGNYHLAGSGAFAPGFPSRTGIGLHKTYNFPINRFTATGAGADMSSIKFARIRLTGGSPGNGAKFCPIAVDYIPNPMSKGTVIFCFDDLHSGVWYNALPILRKFNYPACLFVDSVVKMGQSGFLTAEQVLTLHRYYGWQICNQNYYNETGVVMSPEQISAEHSKFRIAMKALGVTDFGDTSFGSFGTTNIREDNLSGIQRMYRSATLFLNGSNTTPPWNIPETLPFGNPYEVKRMNMSSFTAGTLAARWQDHVDQAIAANGVAIFGGHSEFNSSGEGLTALQTLCDYIRTQELAGLVEVLTLHQAITKAYA